MARVMYFAIVVAASTEKGSGADECGDDASLSCYSILNSRSRYEFKVTNALSATAGRDTHRSVCCLRMQQAVEVQTPYFVVLQVA